MTCELAAAPLTPRSSPRGLESGEANNPSLDAAFAAALSALLHPAASAPTIAVALSGGADSMALTLLAQAWAMAHGGQVIALIVNHGLRGESAAEAAQVAGWMGARGIAHAVMTPPPDDSPNLQASARQRRYDALADYCRDHHILHCLIGHHAGDLRETIALHTARGDTADGASGMSRLRTYRGVRFLRPLLSQEHATLVAYLREQGTVWVEDPSNANLDFARVRVRQILAGNPERVRELDMLAAREIASRAARDEVLAATAMQHGRIFNAGYAELTFDAWQALEARLAQQLLADLLTTIAGATHRPRGGDTARLAAQLGNGMPKRTLHCCEITCIGGILRIARERGRVADAQVLTGMGMLIWDERFTVRYAIAPGAQLVLKALGAKGRKDLRGARRLPASTPCLWHLAEPCFAPHMEGNTVFTHPLLQASIGFTPAKPLAAAPFWCLNG